MGDLQSFCLEGWGLWGWPEITIGVLVWEDFFLKGVASLILLKLCKVFWREPSPVVGAPELSPYGCVLIRSSWSGLKLNADKSICKQDGLCTVWRVLDILLFVTLLCYLIYGSYVLADSILVIMVSVSRLLLFDFWWESCYVDWALCSCYYWGVGELFMEIMLFICMELC